MEKEQSSIEWLLNQIQKDLGIKIKSVQIIEQAKELHKKEIIEAHLDGQYCNVNGEESNKYGEQYYNEKYGQ
ncbi:MAG: hypothetical protein ACK58Q_02565 [Chitinophagales bacterium]|jgi:hypothetical protein